MSGSAIRRQKKSRAGIRTGMPEGNPYSAKVMLATLTSSGEKVKKVITS